MVRMNKDTLYSMSIVDTEKGATITVPETPKGRSAAHKSRAKKCIAQRTRRPDHG